MTPGAWIRHAARAILLERLRPHVDHRHGTTLGAAHYWVDEDGTERGHNAEPPAFVPEDTVLPAMSAGELFEMVWGRRPDEPEPFSHDDLTRDQDEPQEDPS